MRTRALHRPWATCVLALALTLSPPVCSESPPGPQRGSGFPIFSLVQRPGEGMMRTHATTSATISAEVVATAAGRRVRPLELRVGSRGGPREGVVVLSGAPHTVAYIHVQPEARGKRVKADQAEAADEVTVRGIKTEGAQGETVFDGDGDMQVRFVASLGDVPGTTGAGEYTGAVHMTVVY